MTDTKYTRLPVDTAIIYTDRELAERKYSVDDAIKTAEAINKERGRGPLRFAARHRERFSLLTDKVLNISEKNAAVTDVLAYEFEYLKRAGIVQSTRPSKHD